MKQMVSVNSYIVVCQKIRECVPIVMLYAQFRDSIINTCKSKQELALHLIRTAVVISTTPAKRFRIAFIVSRLGP
jgi:hypothetical protein